MQWFECYEQRLGDQQFPDMVMAPLANPAWAQNAGMRPSYRWFRKGEANIYVSDFLSDKPFDDDGEFPRGTGTEVMMGSTDLPTAALSSAVEAVSKYIIEGDVPYSIFVEIGRDWGTGHPEVGPFGAQSVEVNGSAFPEAMRTPRGYVGLLIDRPLTLAPALNLPNGLSVLLELTLLHPEELEHILTTGEVARLEIMRRLRSEAEASGAGYCSSADRPSIVPCPPPATQYANMEAACEAVNAWGK